MARPREKTPKTTKLVWEGAPTGKRPKERPLLLWRDNIAKYLKAMGIEDWMEIARDRNR